MRAQRSALWRSFSPQCRPTPPALDEQLAPVRTLVLRGKPASLHAWQADLAREFLPDTQMVALGDAVEGLPGVLDKPPRPGAVNAWLCQGVTCLEPIGDLVDLKKALKEEA
jgi:uncharacterized protein